MGLFRSIRFHAGVYAHYALQNLKVKMAYPWDFFVNMVGTFVYGVLNVTFLWVLLQKVPDIAGWTFPELVFLYGMGELTFGLFAILFFHLSTKLSEHYIVEGHLDRLLLRPVSPLMQLMMENMDLFDIMILVKSSLLIGWAWSQLPLPFDPEHLAKLLLAAGLGTAVYVGVFLAVASCSFFMPDRGGLIMPLFSLSDVSRFPLTIYPPGIRIFFSYVVPFGFVAFYPAVWVTGKGPLADMAILSLLAAAALSLLAGLLIFRVGLGKYQSTGT